MAGKTKHSSGGSKRKKHHDKDKYYRLAKEQGLRSRAAFKLIQINRKFHILENAKVVLDMCAAPGGWTQIASRTISQNSSKFNQGGRTGGHRGGRDGNKNGGGGIIVAVDILPIRAISPNVITLIGDITTDACHAKIRQTLQTASVDVALCDGAPNVGATYDRDAYAQNEIALLSLKCATSHLRREGSFVTKLYRSQDYSSYMWVIRQLFREVHAVKPASSRSASSEIFLVCLGYKKPDKIDPRLLDPKSVFEQVNEDDDEEEVMMGRATTGGDGNDDDASTVATGRSSIRSSKSNKVNIFHKSYDQKKRSRQGYDMRNVDATFRNIGTAEEFIQCHDPIQFLTDCTSMKFECDRTTPGCCSARKKKKKGEVEEEGESSSSCYCQAYKSHKLTTQDIIECCSDLRVLNKGDFKSLLKWRTDIRDDILNKDDDDDDDDDGSEEEEDGITSSSHKVPSVEDDDNDEEIIEREALHLQRKKLRAKKREMKKERAAAAKRRHRAVLNMTTAAAQTFGIDGAERNESEEQIFSLTTLKTSKDVDAVRNAEDMKQNLGVFRELEEDDDVYGGEDAASRQRRELITKPHVDEHEDEIDDNTGYSFRLDREMDDEYERYLKGTKNTAAKTGTKMAKRDKIALKKKMESQVEEDDELALTTGGIDEDTKAYAKLLGGARDSDDDEDSDEREDGAGGTHDDDGFHDDPATPKEHAKRKKKKKQKEEDGAANNNKRRREHVDDNGDDDDDDEDVEGMNPLIHKLPEPVEPLSKRTERWFSNPLFESVGLTAAVAAAANSSSSNDAKNKAGGRRGTTTTKRDKMESLEELMDDSSSDDDDADDEMNDEDDEDEGGGEEVMAMLSRDDDDNKGEKKKGRENSKKTAKKAKGTKGSGLDAKDVLASIPKTDKQIRHEKRVKALERTRKRDEKKAKKLMKEEEEGEFEVVPATGAGGSTKDGKRKRAGGTDDEKLKGLTEKERNRIVAARALIKAGMGHQNAEGEKDSDVGKEGGGGGGFEVVAAAPQMSAVGLPIHDTRKYDSDHEEYDSDDHARTLALGTMMLRRSKAKSLVDASYNRYAWNDPSDLPEWFMDDEGRNYRPQLPIPPALVEKMKMRFLALSTKPIAKVAEARARKNKRAKTKLAAAKKKAESVAHNSDMTEAMKLRAISKAMRGQDASRPGKTYVVSKKGGGTKGKKGVKLVDKRMKNDKKSMSRADKKRKHGKKGGMTGSKRRRNHS